MTAESHLDDLVALGIAYLRNTVNTADDDKLVAAADAIVALRARAEEAERDAERYRWLRFYMPHMIATSAYTVLAAIKYEEPDDAIDAARQAKPVPSKEPAHG